MFRYIQPAVVMFLTVAVIAFAGTTQPATQPGRPRILIIGDSISIGYTRPVHDLLADMAEVTRIPGNAAHTWNGLEHLKAWLGDTKWDVIHFNWGLHDLKYMRNGKPDLNGTRISTLDQYKANLEQLVDILKTTRARLIWASITPIPEGADGRVQGQEREFNAAARQIMDAHGIVVNDLHSYIFPFLARYQQPRNVHFTQEGYAFLARKVARTIRNLLADQRPPFEMPAFAPPSFPDRVVDIRDHGAVADGHVVQAAKDRNTAILQSEQTASDKSLMGYEGSASKGGQIFETTDLFVSGTGGYHTYRIPALLTTPRGTLLAFCEGRKNGMADTGDIDVLLRRGMDGGRTWGPARLVADDGPNTFGNPCVVADHRTGTIWLLLTHNLGGDKEQDIIARRSKGTRTVWISRSDDDGETWSIPTEITSTTKRPEWTWYATGPGCGIQLMNGRLVVPCDHVETGTGTIHRSHVIYSDDHGTSWKIGGLVGPRVNECQVVERGDGSLVLNMRIYPDAGEESRHRRAIAFSRDRGLTWSSVGYHPDLIEPVCQASFVSMNAPSLFSASPLLFANPASFGRTNMTLRMSLDGGRTWPVSRLLYPGPAAYSALAVLFDKTIGCLYERGNKHPYEKIIFTRLSCQWLVDGVNMP